MDYKIDSNKLMYHPERITKWLKERDSWEKAKEIYPIYLEVSPIGYCNHKCSFCALDFDHVQRQLDINILLKNIMNMADKGVKSIMFAGEGEPLLYKELPIAVLQCKSYGIDTSLTTNFSIDKNMEIYLEHCSWIKVSFNGGTEEVYNKIHGQKHFNTVVENLKKAVKIKKDKGFNCTIGMQMVLIPENIDTVKDFIQLGKEIGVNYVVLKPFSQHKKTIDKTYEKLVYDFGLIDFNIYNTESFKVIYRKDTLDKWNKQERRYSKCLSVPYFWAYLESSGDVYACSCYLSDNKFNLGNIYSQSFSDIWEGNRRKDLFYKMESLDINDCRINCRMDSCNEYLDRIINPQPHDSFI